MLYCPESPFKVWFQNILCKANAVVEEIDIPNSDLNKYYSPQYVQKILAHFMPTYPLWANIMLNDNKKLKEKYQRNKWSFAKLLFFVNDKVTQKTQGVIEQRFKTLKSLEKCGNNSMRLGDVSEKLREHCEATYKTVALDWLKSGKKGKQVTLRKSCNKIIPNIANVSNNSNVDATATPKQSVLLEEKWQKPSESRSTTGKYQKAPNTLYRTPHSVLNKKCTPVTTTNLTKVAANFCDLPYIYSNCWFNSLLQAICKTRLVEDMLASRKTYTLQIQDSRIFLNLLQKVRNGDGPIQEQEMEVLLTGTVNTKHESTIANLFPCGIQHDINEMYFLYLEKYILQLRPNCK